MITRDLHPDRELEPYEVVPFEAIWAGWAKPAGRVPDDTLPDYSGLNDRPEAVRVRAVGRCHGGGGPGRRAGQARTRVLALLRRRSYGLSELVAAASLSRGTTATMLWRMQRVGWVRVSGRRGARVYHLIRGADFSVPLAEHVPPKRP